MKKVTRKARPVGDDRMRPEYDFRDGVRGKYFKAMQAGYTVSVRKADGTTVTREVRPREGARAVAKRRPVAVREARAPYGRRRVSSGRRRKP